jgi:uncharacterized cupin superfamily protein
MVRGSRVRSEAAGASDRTTNAPKEASVPNIYKPDFDVEQDNEPYVWQRALIGRAAGSERLGASLFALPPGGTTFPLHAHLHNEELLIVIAGAPTLRTLEDERMLAPGEVVAFPAGRAGAHQLRNDSDQPVSLLIVSTMVAPEINLFPDTDEIWVRDYVPGTAAPDGAFDAKAPLPRGGC